MCHYGQHSFGHYICYRRKPRHPSVGPTKRWAPPRIIDTNRLGDRSSGGSDTPKVQGDDMGSDNGINNLYNSTAPHYVFSDEVESRPGKGWLRISDDAVRECGIETVLQEGMGAFMLYYERAVLDLPGIYPSSLEGEGRDRSARSSEETLKPELKTVHRKGSVASLVSEVEVDVRHSIGQSQKHLSRLSSSQSNAHPHTYEQETGELRLEEGGPMSGLDLDTRKGRSSTASIPLPTSPLPLSHSPIPGARIVRSVTSRRSASATPCLRASTEDPVSMLNGHATPTVTAMANGLHFDLSASAPSLVDPPSPPVANGTLPTTTTTSKSGSSGSANNLSPKSEDNLKHKSGLTSSQEEVQCGCSPQSYRPNGVNA